MPKPEQIGDDFYQIPETLAEILESISSLE